MKALEESILIGASAELRERLAVGQRGRKNTDIHTTEWNATQR